MKQLNPRAVEHMSRTAALLAADEAALAADCGRLRPAAKVYRTADAALDAGTAVDFLRAHPGNVTLGEVRAAMLGAGKAELPELRETERGLRLIER